jgi:hypothetical protein
LFGSKRQQNKQKTKIKEKEKTSSNNHSLTTVEKKQPSSDIQSQQILPFDFSIKYIYSLFDLIVFLVGRERKTEKEDLTNK